MFFCAWPVCFLRLGRASVRIGDDGIHSGELVFGLLVGKFKKRIKIRWLIALDVFINLAIIFIYKYLAFTVKNLNLVLHAHWKVPEIALPIGISFFTFQAISYVIDVYRGRGEAPKNLLNVGLYISFFPQLIAGPIVRYETIADPRLIIGRRTCRTFPTVWYALSSDWERRCCWPITWR